MSSASLRLALDVDRELVVALRRRAYVRDGVVDGSELHELDWTPWDAEGAVLGAWREHELISTMRCTIIQHRSRLARRLPNHLIPDAGFPCLLLARAATADPHLNRGLNSTLRYHALAAARRAGVAMAVGRVIAAAPRTRLMQALGYRLVPADAYPDERRSYCVALLDLRKAPALDSAELKAGPVDEKLVELLSERFVDALRAPARPAADLEAEGFDAC